MSGVQSNIMEPREWSNILKNIINSNEFKSQITYHGYYLSPEYADFRTYLKKEWNLNSTINTANFLSKDFWHDQSRILRNNNYYLIRSGRGSFVILDEKQFPRPYLNLDLKNAIEIPLRDPEGFNHLKRAFDENILENAGLEQLRFYGVYDKIIENTFGSKQEFYVGIRGNTTKTFDIYFRRASSKHLERIRSYKGQAELDYTIWTRNSVFLFEAKQVKQGNIEYYLDVGWHKFAYPAVRFLGYPELRIDPVYFLRSKDKVFVFVFPRFNFYEKGIILNDPYQMKPQQIFVVTITH
jgi:hypothetical protein